MSPSRRDLLPGMLDMLVLKTIVGVAAEGFVGLWPYHLPVAFIPVAAHARSRIGEDWATTFSSAIGLGILVKRKPEGAVATMSADLFQFTVNSC